MQKHTAQKAAPTHPINTLHKKLEAAPMPHIASTETEARNGTRLASSAGGRTYSKPILGEAASALSKQLPNAPPTAREKIRELRMRSR
jgi:hypothetical protein